MSFIHASPMCSRPLTNRLNMTTPKISTEREQYTPGLVAIAKSLAADMGPHYRWEPLARRIAEATAQPDLLKACEMALPHYKIAAVLGDTESQAIAEQLMAAMRKAKPL